MKQPPGLFSQRVVELAKQIPFGRVTTYGYLAVCAGGHPMLAQMITHILGKHDQNDDIPYHRIVYADGRVWLDPKHQKERLKLYKKEGIKLDTKNRIVDFEKKFFSFK